MTNTKIVSKPAGMLDVTSKDDQQYTQPTNCGGK
jgi:hypothetical protein